MTRRYCLAHVSRAKTTNASLWLDKYITGHDPGGRARLRLVDEVIGISEPDYYSAWFDRWKDSLKDYGAQCREGTVDGRMVVGLGQDSVLETSILLHRTFGVPYIPGTALKGLALSFANKRLGSEWSSELTDGACSILFGSTDSMGYVTFFDAMPFPKTSQLFADVITVHHEHYYQGRSVPPADWDNPNPIPFISSRGKYLVPLSGPEEWVNAAFAILSHALKTIGIGAKTSSGYGRLSLNSSELPR